MSYYYTYYLGYKKDDKYHVLGPFDDSGKLCPVLIKSRSFASSLHDRFYCSEESDFDDKAKEYFSYDSYDGSRRMERISVLPLGELPSGSIIKTGYVLVSDVQAYEKGEEDVFYDVLSPVVYSAKANNERMFGKNPEITDEYGDSYHEPNASEYMYYAWVDTRSEEYEAFIIRTQLETLAGFCKDLEYYILLTEG